MPALARPVRSVLNSRCSASMAPCMRCVTSLITSLIMIPSRPFWILDFGFPPNPNPKSNRRRHLVAYDRADVLAEQRPFDVPLLAQRKNIDGDVAAARQIDGRGVHHLQPLGEHALVGGARDLGG